jgi:hypothetical protein
MGETINEQAERIMDECPELRARVMAYADHPMTDDEAFLEAVKRDNPALHARWMAGPRPELPEPKKRWSVSCDTEEVVTLYGALRTYLKVLTQQQDEDLETIARVTRLMIAIKPQAVEASQEIAGREK